MNSTLPVSLALWEACARFLLVFALTPALTPRLALTPRYACMRLLVQRYFEGHGDSHDVACESVRAALHVTVPAL